MAPNTTLEQFSVACIKLCVNKSAVHALCTGSAQGIQVLEGLEKAIPTIYVRGNHMKIEGTHLFDAPREMVWEMFLDPVVLAKIMPNCQKLEKINDDEYEGKMTIQVGPVQGVFQGKVKLSELNPPANYHMEIHGRGPAGMVDGEGDVRLEDVEGQTLMHYNGEAKVSGRIASVGQRVMDTSARAITKQSLENLDKQIQARLAPQAVQAEPPTPTPEPAPAPKQEQAQEPAPQSRAAENRVAPGPEGAASSPSEYAFTLAKELFNEFVPADKQKWIVVGAGFLSLYLFFNWWTNLIARRVARYLE